MLRRPLLGVVLAGLLISAVPASAALTQNIISVTDKVYIGPRAPSSPKITIDAKTGNITTAGAITATGGVVGGTSPGTFGNGNVSSPSIAFTNDVDTGLYLIGANNIGLALGGVKEVDFGATTVGFSDAITIGGGYGSTGVTISAAGAIQANGALTVDGAATLTGAVACGDTLSTVGAATLASLVCTAGGTFGGGYGFTGATISAAGVGQFNGALTTDGALTADNIVCTNAATFGGGYGSTGVTISTAGNISANGALVVDGASTLTGAVACASTLSSGGAATLASIVCTAGATFGGGYGFTGATLGTEGNIQANGTLTVDGASTLTGAAALNGGLALDTTIFTVADTTGVLSSVPTTTTGNAWTLNFSTLTSGNGLVLKADDDILNGGKVFNILGGALADTTQFNVAEGGVVYTLGLVTATGGLSTGTGYAGTGATISAAGVGQFDGAIITGASVTIATTLDVTGASRLGVQATVVDATTARVCTSADYGKVVILTNATVCAVTLPANGAAVGSTFDVALGGNDSLAATISAATTDTLIGPNDIDLKSVTWAAGHRINAYARFWSDGAFWHVQNLGGTTMAYTD